MTNSDTLQEWLSAILQASPDSISVVDPVRFGLIMFNRPFEDLIFRTRGIQVRRGMRPEDINPEQAEWWNQLYRRVLEQGEVSQDYQISEVSEMYHVSARCLDLDGRVEGICTFGQHAIIQKQAESVRLRSEQRFSNAFRESPFPLTLTSTRHDRYIDANESFLEAIGWSREEVLGKTPSDLKLWVNAEQHSDIARRVLATGEARKFEIAYRTRSGDIRYAMGSAVLIDNGDEPCMLEATVDITDRKRAVESAQESEERLRIAIEAGRLYAFEWDVASDLVTLSKLATKMPDHPNNGARHTQQELIERLEPEDRQNYLDAIGSVTPEKPDYRVMFRLPLRNGRTAWLQESGRAIFGPDRRLRKVIGITSDVTEVRESERVLRELSGRLITAQEEERRRIARELHDNIGQETALLCVLAQRIDCGDAEKENTLHADVHDLYRRIKVLAGDVSRLSHRLHSSELTFLGLEVAAERLCRDFGNQYGIDIDYQVKSLPRAIDGPKSLCLYRILQEALQNVAKHSQASKVVVEARTADHELTLEVRDNGKGFDVEKTGFESGLGLLSMRERLKFVGGSFMINSRSGSGTTVTARVML